MLKRQLVPKSLGMSILDGKMRYFVQSWVSNYDGQFFKSNFKMSVRMGVGEMTSHSNNIPGLV
jgi:hypothetical protein